MSRKRWISKVFLAALGAGISPGCTHEGDANAPEPMTSGSSGTTGDHPVPTTGDDPPLVTGTDSPPSTTTETDDTSTGSPGTPLCGDGVIEGEEACDDGLVANTPNGACLPNCVAARCGDNFVQAGVEECDMGDDANALEYGGCVPVICKWAARCGDGQLDVPYEVCDPGDPDSQNTELVGCDPGCRFKGRIVFLSSLAYDGNLGGLAGADSLCRDLAAGFDTSHAGDYIAWLGDAKLSANERIEHGPEFDATPYVLRSGVQVATNFKDLIDNGPWPGIYLTDTDETIVDADVWTNTAIDGGLFSAENHCEDWGSNSGTHSARAGKNALPLDSPDLDTWRQLGHWTSRKPLTCEYEYHLYCFEN